MEVSVLNEISCHRKVSTRVPCGWPPEAGDGAAGRDMERLISGNQAITGVCRRLTLDDSDVQHASESQRK